MNSYKCIFPMAKRSINVIQFVQLGRIFVFLLSITAWAEASLRHKKAKNTDARPVRTNWRPLPVPESSSYANRNVHPSGRASRSSPASTLASEISPRDTSNSRIILPRPFFFPFLLLQPISVFFSMRNKAEG